MHLIQEQLPINTLMANIASRNKALAQTIDFTNPQESNQDLLHKKMNTLKQFSEVAEKASIFEFFMSVAGSLCTGFQSDWVSYMHESFGEFAENHLLSAQEDKKEINPLLAQIFKLVAKFFAIKNPDGKSLSSTKDFIKVQDKLIGAMNMLTASVSGMVIVFKSLPKFFKQQINQPAKNMPILGNLLTKIMPVFNAALMWMSASVKRRLAYDLQKDFYNKDNKEEIEAAFTSGNQDYICGANSFALMLRQSINSFSPSLANLLEPILASWIALSAFKEGYSAYKERDAETPKYDLHSLDKSNFTKVFYNFTKQILHNFKIDLPEFQLLKP